MPSIDVVIPCYGYGRYLRECVRSVLTQPVEGLRVLIIDDASPDDTPAIATALAAQDWRVSYRRHAANAGHIATYIEGIAWVRAETMLLLSADDYLLPGALPRALGLMDRQPAIGLCFGAARALFDDGSTRHIAVAGGRGEGHSRVLDAAEFVHLCERAGAANIVPTPTAVVRSSLLQRLGGYRADLPHTADFELWLRLAAHAPVGIVGDEQAVYRRHAMNMSLAYAQDHLLADLRQRRAAIDAFASANWLVLPQAPALHAALMRALAREAVGLASSAFNAGRAGIAQELRACALELDPQIRRSAAWQRLALKRLLGTRLWSRLRQARRNAAAAAPVAATPTAAAPEGPP
jgi:glycosyltransferase involved in cell wall biosynthesis